MIEFSVNPGGMLQGRIRVPGDKSITHRAIMLGALAIGETKITGYLNAGDTASTLSAMNALGVTTRGWGEEELIINGVGLSGLAAPRAAINVGNSGTTMRLLAGILSAQKFDSYLTGDQSLLRRPMKRIVDPLTTMGAKIQMQKTGTGPLHIQGNPALQGISYIMKMASAQVKSCLLLAGLYAKGKTLIHEPVVTRNHTENLLQTFGYTVEQNSTKMSLLGGGKLSATRLQIPSDLSSAAFFIVGACIAKNSDVILEAIGINPTRTGIISILILMGANITLENERMESNENVADIRVRSSNLIGIDVPLDQISLAIDEFPALFIAAACAKGITTVRGAEELRLKETDRIAAMAAGLEILGVAVTTFDDGIEIEGVTEFNGGEIESQGDHRIAMAFAIAGLRSQSPIHIRDCEQVATSYPNFVHDAKQLGLNITTEVHHD